MAAKHLSLTGLSVRTTRVEISPSLACNSFLSKIFQTYCAQEGAPAQLQQLGEFAAHPRVCPNGGDARRRASYYRARRHGRHQGDGRRGAMRIGARARTEGLAEVQAVPEQVGREDDNVLPALVYMRDVSEACVAEGKQKGP